MESTDVRNERSGLQELLEARTSDLEKTKMELRDARAQTETCDKLIATLEKDRADLRTNLDKEETAKKVMAELASKRLVLLDEQEDEVEGLRCYIRNMEVEREHMTEDIVGLQQARDTMLERTSEVVDQMTRGQDDTVEPARVSIHDEVDRDTVQQDRCHVERENEELKARLASLLGDHEKLAIAEASLRSEHEDCCVLMAARQVDHNALDNENKRLREQLEKATHDLVEAMADSERSKAATRSFLHDQSRELRDLSYQWFESETLSAKLQLAIDQVDLNKTIPWYEVSDLEKAFCEMGKHNVLLFKATERLNYQSRQELCKYWPRRYAPLEIEHKQEAEAVKQLSFEEQEERLERLYGCHIQEMRRKHRAFAMNIRTKLAAELDSHTHKCTLCIASVRNVTEREIDRLDVEHSAHIDNIRAMYSWVMKPGADQSRKLEAAPEIEIANPKYDHQFEIERMERESAYALDSLKAKHDEFTRRMQHEHETEITQLNAHHNELHEKHDSLVDHLNESHLQELNKLNADMQAKLTDAFEHTRHDREYIAQIDVLDGKILEQQEAIQFDAQGIREDANLITELRLRLADFEDKMTEQGAELKRQKDSAHEHLGSFLDVHSELITTQWAVTQLEKDLKKVEADLEKAHATTTEKNTIINEQRSQHHRINHYLTTTNSSLRRKHAALVASSSANELVLSNSHAQEEEDLKKEHEAGVALLRKAIDKMERLGVEVSDVEGELAGARDEVGFWKRLFEDMEGEVGRLKEEKKGEEGNWGVEALD